jgi:hypothetical protein
MRRRTLLGATAAAVTLAMSDANAADAHAASAAAGVGRDASRTRYLGVFREEDPIGIAADVENLYHVTPASVMWFDSWASGLAFPVNEAKALWRRGIMPNYTWEPWNTALGLNDPGQIHLQDIIDGTWDSYIRTRAREFAAVRLPILVRWGHEFNGNWYPWGIANNNADPSLYVRAYRHVHDLAVAAGARNVQWVWAYNNGSSPDEVYNDPAGAYPGDKYVDWVGIDGYYYNNDSQNFKGLFGPTIEQLKTVAPAKPWLIAETGVGAGPAKPRQISNLLRAVAHRNKFNGFVYFDQAKPYDRSDWRFDADQSSLNAFKRGVSDPTYANGAGHRY